MTVAQTLTSVFTIGTSDGVSSGAGVELTYDETNNLGAINCIEHGTGYQPLAINCNGLDINAANGSNVASFGSAGASISTPLNLAGAVTVALPADPDTRGFIAQPFGSSTYGSVGALASYGMYICANSYWDGAWHQVDPAKYGAVIATRWDAGLIQFNFAAPGGQMAVAIIVDGTGLYPAVDNTKTCGRASIRWSTIYAGTGTINTSDAREKTAITPLTSAEVAAAKALAAEIGTFQFLDAIAAKGVDVARLHIGLTVQRALDIMQAQGLDPTRYGFICHDAWDAQPEVTDPETGEVTQPAIAAGDRYGFRPAELLLFIARGFDARLSALEAKA